MLNVDKVISVIASITPFLLIFIVIISIYSMFTMDLSFADLKPIALSQEKTFTNWFISAVNYVSFNIAVGAGMSLVTGGAEQDEGIAGMVGVMITLAYLAIFSQVNIVATYDLPLLKIVEDISPILSFIMSMVLFGMIFNTALGMFYGFVARFFQMGTRASHIATVVTLIFGFMASFLGFTTLVSKVYSIIGYLGFFLIIALIYAPFRMTDIKDGAA